jgi:photosystem II stability/assembly factor-like uncharacterized protein
MTPTRPSFVAFALLSILSFGCDGAAKDPEGSRPVPNFPNGGGGTTGGGDSGSGSIDGGASDAGDGGARDGGPTDAGAVKDAGVDAGPRLPDPCVDAGTCPPGVWINVTPANMPASPFGPGSIAQDPARPSHMYVGGSSEGLWRSTDYGNTWTKLTSPVPDVARGAVIVVAGTTPATLWAAGYNSIYKSTDGAVTWKQTNLSVSLYSPKVDPYDPTHLISGLHEANGIYESTNGGETWVQSGTTGFPGGGVSWYPYFIDTGDAATTRKTWFAIAQNGASAVMTHDQGASWAIPNGLNGLNHPHGNSQIYQNGSNLFVAGTGGPGRGVYRSTDLGANWARVDNGQQEEAVVWGTSKNIYAMYAWACSHCVLAPGFEIAPQPGTTWTRTAVPPALRIGPNSVAVTSDGNHNIFVGLMWDQGLWRYIEP